MGFLLVYKSSRNLFNKKVPKKLIDKVVPKKKSFLLKFRDLIFFKLESQNRVGLQNIRN